MVLCSVEDNGRGIPVDIHPQKNIYARRYDKITCRWENLIKITYKYSGGLHGVGVFC